MIENLLCLFFTGEAKTAPLYSMLLQIIIRFSAFKSKLQAFKVGHF